jgi:hypothetical protein
MQKDSKGHWRRNHAVDSRSNSTCASRPFYSKREILVAKRLPVVDYGFHNQSSALQAFSELDELDQETTVYQAITA